MNEADKQLAKAKQQMESLTAPAELRERLEQALAKAAPPARKPRRRKWTAAAAAVFLTLIIGNSYHAFAYYGKQLLGYDEISNSTLQQLNLAGRGQAVEREMVLNDGTTLTIEGLMSDANRLIIYYRLNNSAGVQDAAGALFTPRELTGFLTSSSLQSGTAMLNEDGTELTGMLTFEPVSTFAKKLTLHFGQQTAQGQTQEEALTFPYYPDQAMATQFKQSIHQKVQVDQGVITFRSITATPTMTLIKGKLEVENFDRVNLALHGIELLADGAPVTILGSGTHSSWNGYSFELRYDALPENLESLRLSVKAFAGYQQLDRKLALASLGEESLDLDGRHLWVKQVNTTTNGVYITLATEEDVMLEGVTIESADGSTELRTITDQKYPQQPDGTIVKERTLIFDTGAEPEYLLIEGMNYLKEYNRSIEIPVK